MFMEYGILGVDNFIGAFDISPSLCIYLVIPPSLHKDYGLAHSWFC